MADQRYHDSFRGSGEGTPRTDATSGPRKSPGNDPLAELARLIGQHDPFGAFPREAAPRPGNTEPPRMEELEQPGAAGSQHDDRRRPASSEEYLDRVYYSEPARVPAAEPAHHAGEHDLAAYESPPEEAHGHEAGDYYADADAGELDHHGYEQPLRHGRRAKILVVALLCFAVVGTAGAYGIRLMLGHRGSSPPPVIAADQTPTKIIPAKQAAEAQSNKAIQDRVGDRGANEKLVSREEQPVDMQDPAKSFSQPGAFPKPGGTNAAPAATGVIASNGPAPPAWVTQNEPKKVRTLPIRPDQQNAAASPAPPPARTASAGPAPVAAARSTAKPPAREPVAPANAPLSLAPQSSAADAVPPAPKARTASVTPAPSQTGSVAGEGGFAVQVASQRSETDAQATFRALQTKYASVLGDRSPIIRRADLGQKGVYYRAMVGGFASEEEAKQFCGSLKAAGGQCLIQRN